MKREPIEQAAALAIRNGQLCVLLARSGNHWVIPKGKLERGKSHIDIVHQEAWEEAGIRGMVHDKPLGRYAYRKSGRLHTVTVYRMDVLTASTIWPECLWRERRWVRVSEATRLLRRKSLRKLVASFFADLPLRQVS